MKLLLLLLSLSLGFSAYAVVPNELLDMSCRKEIEAVLKKHGSKEQWARNVDPQEDVRAYRSPTSKIGKWVEIMTYPDPYVLVYTTQNTIVHQWAKKDCVLLNQTETKPLGFQKPKKESFTDKSLEDLMDSDAPSMIYVWSPVMTYSMTEMHVFKDGAKKMGINFVPVLDSDLSDSEIEKITSGYTIDPQTKFQRFFSLDLFMRNAQNHYPSSFFVGNKKISKLIFGVLTPEALEQTIREQLADLKGDRR